MMTKPRLFRTLTGAGRLLMDARVSIWILGRLLAQRRRRGLTFSDIIEMMRRSVVISAALGENKQIRFGGRVFSEAWSPPWPDPGLLETVVAFGSERPFCPYVVFAITSKCMFRCEHCYAIETLGNKEVLSSAAVLRTVDAICDSGIGVLSLEGGEPLLRYDDLLAALRRIDGRATAFIATTGWGLDERKASELAGAGLVAAQISLDHHLPEKHNAFRNNPKAFDAAANAVSLFGAAGVFPILAVCATREVVRDDGLYRYLEVARDLGAGMIQVIDPMPSGKYLRSIRDSVLSRSELAAVIDFHRVANTAPKYRDYPAVCARAHVEAGTRFGCGLGGNSIFYVDASGNVQPCVYTNMAVGNVLDEELASILERMRAMFPKTVGGLCPAYAVAKPIARAIEAGEPSPVGIEMTRKLAAKLMTREEPTVIKQLGRDRVTR